MPSYQEHLNKHNVIRIGMQEFLGKERTVDGMIKKLCAYVSKEIFREYPDIDYVDKNDFIQVLRDVYEETKIPYIILIDEWDCLFRRHKEDSESQTTYLNFLRDLLKNKSYVALAYMTGILPIKKYGEHSAINVFYEYSMTDAKPISEFTGFTESEVKALCGQYDKPFEQMKRWYDGFTFGEYRDIYNPWSITNFLQER